MYVCEMYVCLRSVSKAYVISVRGDYVCVMFVSEAYLYKGVLYMDVCIYVVQTCMPVR